MAPQQGYGTTAKRKRPPLHTRKGNRTLGLSKTTLGGRVHVQPVGLNAETKKDRHRADGERCLLTFPLQKLSGTPVSLWDVARPQILEMLQDRIVCQAAKSVKKINMNRVIFAIRSEARPTKTNPQLTAVVEGSPMGAAGRSSPAQNRRRNEGRSIRNYS
jgi:hypothetical protein